MLLHILAAIAPVGGSCPPPSTFAPIATGSVYIGEIHGTVEVPAMVACVVDLRVKTSREPITVSLELPNVARDGNNDFWRGTDGRSSAAMWKLVSHLLSYEARGKIKVHFQQGNENFANQAELDERTGKALLDLSTRGTVIAFGGNFHSMREPPSVMPELKPAGMFTGKAVKHVRIESVRGGAAWLCRGENKCGPNKIVASPIKGAADYAWIDGAKYEHDFVFFVQRATSSPPHLQIGSTLK